MTCNNIVGGHIMPIDPTNTFTLPLDAKHSLTLIPAHLEVDKTEIHRSTYASDISFFPMLAHNHGQEQNAQRFLIGSRKGLTEYFNMRREAESPNPTERVKKTRQLIEQLKETF